MHLGGGGGVNPPIRFHCVLHAKKEKGIQKACKIAYVINRRPHTFAAPSLYGTRKAPTLVKAAKGGLQHDIFMLSFQIYASL